VHRSFARLAVDMKFAIHRLSISISTDRAILSNGPGGPGPRAPNLQGAPRAAEVVIFS